jgi:hypothetical protein
MERRRTNTRKWWRSRKRKRGRGAAKRKIIKKQSLPFVLVRC